MLFTEGLLHQNVEYKDMKIKGVNKHLLDFE